MNLRLEHDAPELERRPPVLLAEDDDDMRGLLGLELVRLGFDTHLVPDGAAAWEALGDARFCAAVLDVRMPGRSGLEILISLRHAGSTLPVVLISGFADDIEDLASEYGAAVLAKPFSARDLRQVLVRRTAQAHGARC